MIASNFFERIPEVYKTEIQNNKEYIEFQSRVNIHRRTVCFMKRSYMLKIIISLIDIMWHFQKSNGNGGDLEKH